jgi:Na+/proline symporter
MDDFGNFMSLFVVFCITIPLLVAVLASVVWAYGDAERRGKSGCLVALLVFLLTWPAGLIIWLLIRPENEKFK